MTERTLKSNEFWGKRSGYFCPYRPKGQKHQFGFCFPCKNWTSTNSITPIVIHNTGRKK